MGNSNLKNTLQEKGYVLHTTVGVSMEPMLSERKTVVEVHVPEREYRIDDVVLFVRGENTYVMHRIIGKKDGIYLICGDNQWYRERVKPEQLLGYVTRYYRDGVWHTLEEPEYLEYVAGLGRVRRRLFWRALGGRVLRKLGIRK